MIEPLFAPAVLLAVILAVMALGCILPPPDPDPDRPKKEHHR